MLIFISYSRHDGGVHAKWIDTELTALGFETWLDRRDVSSTSDFTADIENNIERASYIVVCITRDTTRQNSFVRREIQYALYREKPVIPVRFEAIVPSHFDLQ